MKWSHLAAAWGAGLLAGWLLLPRAFEICGVYSSAAAPAWVQAIGSVAAIFIAAGIPAFQERKRAEELRKRLSISTVRLRSNLEALGASVIERAALVRGFKVTGASTRDIDALMNRLNVWEMNPISNSVDDIHDLDKKITKPIIDLLEEYDQYLIVHERVRSATSNDKHDQMRAAGSSLILRLERIGELAFKASTAIRLIDEESRYPDLKARNEKARKAARN